MNKIIIAMIVVVVLIAAILIINFSKQPILSDSSSQKTLPQNISSQNTSSNNSSQNNSSQNISSGPSGLEVQKIDVTKYKNSESNFVAELMNFIIDSLHH